MSKVKKQDITVSNREVVGVSNNNTRKKCENKVLFSSVPGSRRYLIDVLAAEQGLSWWLNDICHIRCNQ